LILAGGERGFPLDYHELERWTRVGYERGMRSRKGSGEGVTTMLTMLLFTIADAWSEYR
jgi:hypothetical protein